MGRDLYFSSIVTKSLETINSEERFFEGYLTVEVKDKQGEITIVDELYKVLPVWMDRGAPISDTHSNRIIGKGINFARATYKSEGQEIPAIKITGKIHKNYELDNEIWSKIKSGEYKGLSFGGATKANRTPKVMKDGSVAYQLTDLEHYEVAVCKDPAVPLALITDFNPVAKAMANNTEDRDGKMVIKCSKFGCRIDLNKAKKKKQKLTEGGRKVLQEATTVADLYKVDLSGIATFEGKVEALMDEGKSRQSAENIVGSFTKKTDYSTPDTKDNTDAYWKKQKEKKQHQADHPLDYDDDGNYSPQNCPTCGASPHAQQQDDYDDDDDYDDYDDDDDYDYHEYDVDDDDDIIDNKNASAPRRKKKDAPTGHDPTQVAHSPDTPREMELEKGKDHSNTGGDTSGMYNQNGAEQRVNSKKAAPLPEEDPDKVEGEDNLKNYLDSLDEETRKKFLSYDEIQSIMRKDSKKGAVGGEVPPQWTGSGSPYPEGERKVIKRKKIIKESSWKDLKNKAFELDMQWKVIDLVKDALDGRERISNAPPLPKEEDQTFGGQAKRAREHIHTDYHQTDEESKNQRIRESKMNPRKNEEDSFDKLDSAQESRLDEVMTKQPRTPPTGKAPIKGKKKALFDIAKKLKRETIQGKLLAGSDPEVSSKLLEHGKQIEEHHKPLKQRVREHHSQPSGDSPQVGLKHLKEQERSATNDPKDDHWGSGQGRRGQERDYEAGYSMMGGNDDKQQKPVGSEEQFHRSRAREKIPPQNRGESDSDYKQRQEAYVHEKINPQNMKKALIRLSGLLKGEGFAGYEKDQDPETHVKIQSADHTRTGSAQQAQYDGTEGKSESKEKPLKELTDGELEEVEKLGKAKKKAMELSKMRSDKWDKDEKDEFNRYTGADRGYHGEDDEEETEQEVEHKEKKPYTKEDWIKDGKEMQAEHQQHAGDKRLPKDYRSHATDLDEKIGEELGEVPRSKVQETDSKTGKKLVSPHGKHMAKRIIHDATENVLDDSDAKDLRDRAVNAAHALTITEDNAKKWKSFRKAMNVIKRRRGIDKDAISNDNVQEMLARPKKELHRPRGSGSRAKPVKIAAGRSGDWHKQQLQAKRYAASGGDNAHLEPHPRTQGSKRKWEALRPQSGEKYEGIVDHEGKPVLVGDKKRDQRGAHQGRNMRGRKIDPNEQKTTGAKGEAQAAHRSATHDKKLGHGYLSEENRAATKLPDEETLDRQIQAKEHGKIEGKEKPPTEDLSELKRRAQILSQKTPTANIRSTPRGGKKETTAGDKWMEHYANNRYKLMTPEEQDKLTKALQVLKEGTNAANGTSPRGGNFMGTNDTEAFNVRHNGGRKTNRHGKRAEDLGNFP